MRRFLLSGALLLVSPAWAGAHAAAPRVAIRSGALRGVTSAGVTIFRGVPYAAPPVGPLRWRPPTAPVRWAGVRDATRFGPSCPQSETMGGFAAPGGSEDCLYLNVFSPAGHPAKAMPVMLWIHGGALRGGSGGDYDARALARDGVVVVTINYRLGALGFYANPALGADNRAPNYATLDQVAALRWVRRNIRAFGGDPGRVTVFGESAGARAIQVLLASPLAEGLFQRAILESISADNTIPLAIGRQRGEEIARKAGCAPDDVRCLRDLPVSRLLDAQAGPSIVPIAGGADLPEPPGRAIAAGRFHRVPIIFGWNRDETTWQTALVELRRGVPIGAADYSAALAAYARHDAHAADDRRAIADAYRLASFPDPGSAVARIRTDAAFVCPTLRMLGDMSRYTTAYGYEFAEPGVPMYMPPVSFAYGISHTSELQFLFPGFHGASGTKHALSPAQQDLARRMRRLWTGFAARGAPDSRVWPEFSSRDGRILAIASPRPTSVSPSYYQDRHCDLWNSIAGP